MELRAERAADRPAVRAVHLAAFGSHGPTVADLADGLRETLAEHDGLSLVAELDGEVVGHVLFTRALLDAERRLVDVQVLSPVAVLPARQRTGIGTALIREGLAILDRRSVPLVFLEGPPAYYTRFGFASGAEQGFRKPSLRIPDPAFMAIRLRACKGWMSGTLVYPDVFWRHDAVGLRG